MPVAWSFDFSICMFPLCLGRSLPRKMYDMLPKAEEPRDNSPLHTESTFIEMKTIQVQEETFETQSKGVVVEQAGPEGHLA